MILGLRLLIPPPLLVGPRLFVVVGVVALYTAVVALLDNLLHLGPLSRWDAELTAVNALILGTLLTFRINEAKRRWWEARTLWGQLINDLRNLALKANSLARLEPAQQKRWGLLLVAFAEALQRHLRGACKLQEIPGFADDPHRPDHVPLYVAGLIQVEVTAWQRDGKLVETGLWLLDIHTCNLMNICGGCERIQTTPVPSSFRALLHHGLWLNAILAPLFLVPQASYWSVLIIAVSTYFVMGIDLVAVHIEEPFGSDGDDLPLEAYCRSIDQSVSQVMQRPG
jgi:putative membrane protein